ncbi:MAG: hypothetical protein WCJ94_07385 [bacterium]
MKVNKKIYTMKRPSHPDDAQTKAKRFFKTKGRKRARQAIKKMSKIEIAEV